MKKGQHLNGSADFCGIYLVVYEMHAGSHHQYRNRISIRLNAP